MDDMESSLMYWRGLIDKEKLEKFIIHQDDEVIYISNHVSINIETVLEIVFNFLYLKT